MSNERLLIKQDQYGNIDTVTVIKTPSEYWSEKSNKENK